MVSLNRGLVLAEECQCANRDETPVSIPGNFPYAPLPKSRTGNRVIDNGSFQEVPTPGADAARTASAIRPHASNVLMVAGKRSRSGHPLFVGGPQIGYYYPGLTLEMDLHGPGWTARGATSAPFPGYILIGRREDFVWTLTSAGADIVDDYVETLSKDDQSKYAGDTAQRGTDARTEASDAGVPESLSVLFEAPYDLGPLMLEAVLAERKEAGIDSLFRRPPTSDSAYLTPSRLLDGSTVLWPDGS